VKIEVKKVPDQMLVENAPAGEVFQFEDRHYIAISENPGADYIRAVNLRTGHLVTFGLKIPVTPVNCKLVIE
jgi:hypothetical protein